MEPVIRPPVHPVPPRVAANDPRCFGVDVVPRLVVVSDFRQHDGQGAAAAAIEIVTVVAIERRDPDGGCVSGCLPDDLLQPRRIEGWLRLAAPRDGAPLAARPAAVMD